jgi:colanic acid biosynthesis protein WcaH
MECWVWLCEESGYIPSDIFKKVVKCVPIASVEAIIITKNGLLFLKRNNEPAKGKWWFPGGRIRKEESLEDALKREVKEETGLVLTRYRLINVYSRVFPERHDVTIAYLCSCGKGDVVLNEEHSEYRFLKVIPPDLHAYLKETIQDSKWWNNHDRSDFVL